MFFWVLVPTACVVALFAVVGAGRGGRVLWRSLALLVCAAAAALAVGLIAWQAQLFQPFGLLTPVAGALLAFVACRVVLVRLWSAPAADAGIRNRIVGGLLGGAMGLYVAAWGWILADVAVATCTARLSLTKRAAMPEEDVSEKGVIVPRDARSPMPSASSPTGLQQLFRIANRGFVRHLPFVGSVSEECQATIDLLNAPPEQCRQFVAKRAWSEWTRLPAYQALCHDREFQRDLQALRSGDVTALYRLQRNRRLGAFVARHEVQELLPGLRPTVLAAELRTFVDETGAADAATDDR